MQVAKFFIILGSLNAMFAVMLGAFAAHGLRSRISPEMLDVFNTAVQYHFYHAMGLLITGLLVLSLPPTGWMKYAGWFMLAGIVFFSGSLYLLALGMPRWLGVITPFGGLAFIFAWALLAAGVVSAWNLSI